MWEREKMIGGRSGRDDYLEMGRDGVLQGA
jgi:hypothetical protein